MRKSLTDKFRELSGVLSRPSMKATPHPILLTVNEGKLERRLQRSVLPTMQDYPIGQLIERSERRKFEQKLLRALVHRGSAYKGPPGMCD